MALTKIGIGTAPNDGTGDSPRVAGAKINTAFDQIDENTDALGGYSLWAGTQAEYDALTPDADTLYFILEGS
jgi:hypothetical protein